MAFVLTTSPGGAAGPRLRSGGLAPRIGGRAPARRPRRVVWDGCAAQAAKQEEEEVFDDLAARVAEIKEVIDGLQQFKTRIEDDVTRVAKKVRAPKKQVVETLKNHPDIIKIDTSIEELEAELKTIQSTE